MKKVLFLFSVIALLSCDKQEVTTVEDTEKCYICLMDSTWWGGGSWLEFQDLRIICTDDIEHVNYMDTAKKRYFVRFDCVEK